jgi:hypothetical protein
LFYEFGPKKRKNKRVIDNDDELYWEKDDTNPNQIIYDLENNKIIIPNSEDDLNNKSEQI